jgi:general secretion pathway protein F
MPDFQYIAREFSGRQVTGVLSAQSEREAVGMLSSQSLFPVQVTAKESAQARQTRQAKRVPAGKLATFYSQLADLLRAGVPLLRSLDLLQKQTVHPGLQLVVKEIRDQVADGNRLAEALRKHPAVFNDLTVSIVRAGEEGGFLEDSLQRIATFTEHQEELKAKVIGAMVYPVILMVLGTGIVAFMLVYFVPKFEPLFEGLREAGQLPFATTLLLAISGTLQSYGWLVLLALLAGGYFGQQLLQSKEGRRQLDVLRLKVWGIGNLLRSLAIARFCRVLGTLLHNGVPMLNALRISKDAMGNLVLSEAVGTAAERISSGKSLARPLAESGHFPIDVIEMISVGEEANNLEQVLIQVAEKMERFTQRRMDLAVRLLEPLMLVVMAAIILFVMMALLLPIFKSSQMV